MIIMSIGILIVWVVLSLAVSVLFKLFLALYAVYIIKHVAAVFIYHLPFFLTIEGRDVRKGIP